MTRLKAAAVPSPVLNGAAPPSPAKATHRRGAAAGLRAKALLALLATLVVLAIGEIAMRSILARPTIYVPSENERLVYELRPNFKQNNRYGMRDADFSWESLRGKFVVACVGDSHTYSLAVQDAEHSYPARLQHHLEESLPGRGFKVLNLGVPGYNMAQELEVLRKYLPRVKIDAVVLQYCINDTHVCNYIRPEYPNLNHWLHKSCLVAELWKTVLYSSVSRRNLLPAVEEHFPDALLFEEGLVGTRSLTIDEPDPAHRPHPPRSPKYVPARYHWMLGQDHFLKHLQSFATMAREAGIPLTATGFIRDADKDSYHDAGFDVYSFYEILHDSGKTMEEFGYSDNDTAGHFNDRGCDLIAQKLARRLHERLGPRIFEHSGRGGAISVREAIDNGGLCKGRCQN